MAGFSSGLNLILKWTSLIGVRPVASLDDAGPSTTTTTTTTAAAARLAAAYGVVCLALHAGVALASVWVLTETPTTWNATRTVSSVTFLSYWNCVVNDLGCHAALLAAALSGAGGWAPFRRALERLESAADVGVGVGVGGSASAPTHRAAAVAGLAAVLLNVRANTFYGRQWMEIESNLHFLTINAPV